jgi:hypothetical protein
MEPSAGRGRDDRALAVAAANGHPRRQHFLADNAITSLDCGANTHFVARCLRLRLTTAVANDLPVKIILLNNNSLAEVKFEQRDIGNPEWAARWRPSISWACDQPMSAEEWRKQYVK